MTKPIGPICNLDCAYCFYLEKQKIYPDERSWKMADDVLENYIDQYIQSQPADAAEIMFAWQGGEPTLLGVDYFRKIVKLQEKYAGGRPIQNALQTNGTLLDDQWCEFLTTNKFLVGISIDGPRELHDTYRVDKKQQPTFDRVMNGVNLLKKHGTDFNTLTVVNRANSYHALKVYNFLRQIGSQYIQFIPLVERLPETELPDPKSTDDTVWPLSVRGIQLDLAAPPIPGQPVDPTSTVTDWSVEPIAYGEFLCTIFDEWIRRHVGQTFVQLFDMALGQWAGYGSSMCYFAPRCGSQLAIEHNGDVYSCDHYVYPRYKLGNIMNTSLGAMVQSPEQVKFGNDKFDTLPKYCRQCSVRWVCNGECPKHRFIRTPDGEEGLNYLCAAYKRFFTHIDGPMKAMASLIQSGRPAALVMNILREKEHPQKYRAGRQSIGRNDPCPCGSGKKYKKCCGAK